MEIQPPSSVAQATARFTGLSQQQVKDSIRRIYPYPAVNTNLHSKNSLEAISVTGSFKDYREKDYIEAHRLLQGVITNPWQSIHDIEAGKADPFYHDSGVSQIGDIQQQVMGTVTGAPQLQDPRMAFVGNLLKLKTFQKSVDNTLSYNYMKDLFLTQVENGSTYYQKQAMSQDASMKQHFANSRARIEPLDHHIFMKSTNYGNMAPPHSKRSREIVVNPTPHFAHNPKRAKLDHLHDRFSSHIIEPRLQQDPNQQIYPHTAQRTGIQMTRESHTSSSRDANHNIIEQGVPKNLFASGMLTGDDASTSFTEATLKKSRFQEIHADGLDGWGNQPIKNPIRQTITPSDITGHEDWFYNKDGIRVTSSDRIDLDWLGGGDDGENIPDLTQDAEVHQYTSHAQKMSSIPTSQAEKIATMDPHSLQNVPEALTTPIAAPPKLQTTESATKNSAEIRKMAQITPGRSVKEYQAQLSAVRQQERVNRDFLHNMQDRLKVETDPRAIKHLKAQIHIASQDLYIIQGTVHKLAKDVSAQSRLQTQTQVTPDPDKSAHTNTKNVVDSIIAPHSQTPLKMSPDLQTSLAEKQPIPQMPGSLLKDLNYPMASTDFQNTVQQIFPDVVKKSEVNDWARNRAIKTLAGEKPVLADEQSVAMARKAFNLYFVSDPETHKENPQDPYHPPFATEQGYYYGGGYNNQFIRGKKGATRAGHTAGNPYHLSSQQLNEEYANMYKKLGLIMPEEERIKSSLKIDPSIVTPPTKLRGKKKGAEKKHGEL